MSLAPQRDVNAPTDNEVKEAAELLADTDNPMSDVAAALLERL